MKSMLNVCHSISAVIVHVLCFLLGNVSFVELTFLLTGLATHSTVLVPFKDNSVSVICFCYEPVEMQVEIP